MILIFLEHPHPIDSASGIYMLFHSRRRHSDHVFCWMVVVSPTDHPKSARIGCASVFVVSLCCCFRLVYGFVS